MDYRMLGHSGYRVSRICFGSLTMGPLCAALSLEEGAALLNEAFALGINFIDTAEQYANYPYIRKALDAYSDADKVVIATKTFAETDIQASWAIEDARMALRRDKIDIFLLHEIRNEADFAQRAGAWKLLNSMKNVGVIGAVGLSTHSAAVVSWAAQREDIDIIHCMLNKPGIGILDGDCQSMLTAIRMAKEAGKGVYTMKALGGGALMRQAREALDWAFSRPEPDAIALGCKDMAELHTNVNWLLGLPAPEAEQIKKLQRKIVFDKDPKCHGCGACVKRCASGAMHLDENQQASWDESKCVYCGYCIAACPWFCLSFC